MKQTANCQWTDLFGFSQQVPNEELKSNGQGLYSRLWCIWEIKAFLAFRNVSLGYDLVGKVVWGKFKFFLGGILGNYFEIFGYFENLSCI